MKRTKWFWNWLLIQGLFIVITALWALLNVESFMQVTGPKTDIWLVKTVATLGLCVGSALLISWFYKEEARSILFLALSISAGFAFLDIYYYLKGTIIWTYLIDAVLQIIFLFGYGIILKSK